MDYQAVGVGLGSILTAIAAVLGGIYTGKNSRKTDDDKAKLAFESFRLEREKAEEIAAKSRIEAIVEDAALARRRLRESEAEYDQLLHESRTHAQRGWDLARYHFGLLSTVVHLMNNIFQVETSEGSPDQLMAVVRNSKRRMDSINIPLSLEDPIPLVLNRADRK